MTAATSAATPETSAATCAYPWCQAGGVILAGAPLVDPFVLLLGDQPGQYHPGCWAAEQSESAA